MATDSYFEQRFEAGGLGNSNPIDDAEKFEMTTILSQHQADPGFGRFEGGAHRPLMAMVEITSRCDMACPLCFARSSEEGVDLSVAQVMKRFVTLKQVAGIIPLQLSGGEPTLHPQLPKIITAAKDIGFTHIELVTNGVRIGEDPAYLQHLAGVGLTAVYLQFDGLRKQTYIAIRGRDMSGVRPAAVAAVKNAGLCCTLAVAVVKGVNDDELGDIVRYAAANIDTVRAVNFQTASRFSGRYDLKEPASRYTLASLVKKIETQADLRPGSFSSILLGHSACNTMSLVFLVDDRLEPLFAHLPEAELIEYLGDVREEIVEDLFRGKNHFLRKHLANPRAWRLLRHAAPIFGRFPRLRTLVRSRHLLLFAKSFMERQCLASERVRQCTYGIADDSGIYCFCAYNNLHRHTAGGRHEHPS